MAAIRRLQGVRKRRTGGSSRQPSMRPLTVTGVQTVLPHVLSGEMCLNTAMHLTLSIPAVLDAVEAMSTLHAPCCGTHAASWHAVY